MTLHLLNGCSFRSRKRGQEVGGAEGFVLAQCPSSDDCTFNGAPRNRKVPAEHLPIDIADFNLVTGHVFPHSARVGRSGMGSTA